MGFKRNITALMHDLDKVSRIIKNICTLVEDGTDSKEILSQTRRVHAALSSVQQALIESENDLCIEEIVNLKSIPSKIERLNSHIELISRYGR